MSHPKIAIKILDNAKDLPLPAYATEQSAGMDVVAAINEAIILNTGDYAMVPTGISIALPAGYECQVRPRSGLAAKNGVTVLNAPGTVDADYRGEIKASLNNHGKQPYTLERGMRIAQLVISKYEHISWEVKDTLDETERGAGGFGSTGIK
jgi:dUTP pyrophosphatase